MTAGAAQLLNEAAAAISAGDFDRAVERTRESLAIEPTAAAHDLYAALMLADDRLQECRAHWEAAFRSYRQAGDDRAAIKAAVNIAMLHSDAAIEAATRGWLNRARRLADSVGHCVERGYIDLALLACDVPDVHELEAAAERALALALEFGDANLEARALADLGVALISQGRIADGFARIDEAMAAVSAGEVTDPGQAGSIFCAMLTACERTGEVRRAEEWVRACESYVGTHLFAKFPVLSAHCRIAYGRVLCDAGRLDDAEAEVRTLEATAATAFVSKQAAAAALLADLRMTQGRLEEARDLLAPFADRAEVCQELARLHLLTGESKLAIATATRALGRMPGDRLRGGSLLALIVEAHLACGDVAAARDAADRLATMSAEAEGAWLRAEAELALGRCLMRAGDAGAAAEAFVRAREHLGEDGRPLLEARTLLADAEAQAALGETTRAIEEARAALTAFDRLGAKRCADEAAALLRSLGAPGRARARLSKDDLESLTAREHEVLALLAEGLTNAAIAERLFITPKTTEHHVGRILSKLGVSRRSEVAALLAQTK